MKRGEIRELRDLSVPDLQAKAQQINGDLFSLRLKHSLGQLDNPMQIRSTRRDLARVNTMLAERLREDAQASKG